MINYQNLKKSLEEAFGVHLYTVKHIVDGECVLAFIVREDNGAAFAEFYPELFERTYESMTRTKIMCCVASIVQIMRGERTASAKKTLYEFIEAGLVVLY